MLMTQQTSPSQSFLQNLTNALSGNQGGQDGVFTPFDFALVMLLSFACGLIIGKVYKATHRGISYSQSNVQTYVLMCVVVSLIMLIIGSNIARAFTLVGALSIVRFRNAVKESRDIGFVFWAMAVGMCAGTRFYGEAIFATITISVFVFIMHYFNMFARSVRERILLVEVPADMDHEQTFRELFEKTFQEHFLISMETMPEGETVQLTYSVNVSGRFESGAFLKAVRALTGNRKVSLIEGQQQLDL